jgi:hypothetical protein
MHTSILITALALAVPQAQDTVIPVERGTRLDVQNFRGEVLVDAWTRDEVRIVSDLDSRQLLDASRTGASLRVRTRPRGGGPGDADFRITVPRWMDVRVEGNQVDVQVRGTEGEVIIETVSGDIVVDGGRGLVSIRSIQGEVTVRNARGNVEAKSVNEDVALYDIEGDVYVETTNGDVTLRGVLSGRARATTVNGDIEYDGTIRDDGRYAFSTHNGDVEVTVAETANVTVSVSTYHGEFESDFPVRLTGTTRDRKFNFTLGSGRAQLELESFNGEIRLRRPR